MQAGFALATPLQSIPDLPQRILLLENSRASARVLATLIGSCTRWSSASRSIDV